jgi:AraC-like DNA-binding protein
MRSSVSVNEDRGDVMKSKQRKMPANLLRLRERASERAMERIRKDRSEASREVEQMLAYLEEHLFDQGLTVGQVRAAVGIGDNSINLRFHAEIGTPPRRYITERRLETVRWLLGETGVRVWQIGLLSGYSTLGSFSKSFETSEGMRPTAYREQARKTEGPFTHGELKAAVEGRLPLEDARRLIKRLALQYPEAVDGLLEGKEEGEMSEEAEER